MGPNARWIAIAAAIVLATACSGSVAAGPASTAAAPTARVASATAVPVADRPDVTASAPVPQPLARKPGLGTPAPSAALAATDAPHIFVIVMENESLEPVLQQPYVASLAATYAVATNYHAVGSPSLPNYLALTSGSTWGIHDDGYRALPAGGIGQQLDAAGVAWRAYMEGLTARGCVGSPDPYAVKHNPFAYYGGACPKNVVPFGTFAADARAGLPSFVWITPDLCHDGHDCALSTADQWLAGMVPQITATAEWRDGGVLFIVWDEPGGRGSTNVPLLVVSNALLAHTTSVAHDHYSLLATVEDLLHVARLGSASSAQALTELLRIPQRSGN